MNSRLPMGSLKVSLSRTANTTGNLLEMDHNIIKSKSAIERLPVDTLMEIMALVHPKDIITIRMTCKTLSVISRERNVWTKQLRSVCDKFGIFRPTFPEHNMNVSQLEHAASSPARFVSHLRRNLSRGTIRPVYTRILYVGPDSDTTLESYFLVPGGRYLVTALRNGRIQLWDLGFSPHMAISPYPIASTDIQNFMNVRCLGPIGDGLGIRMVAMSNYAAPLWHGKIDVFDIYPLSTSPKFTHVNSLVITISASEGVATHLADELLLLHVSSTVIVWNVVQDTRAKFDIGDRTDSQPIFVGDGNIITLEENYIDIFQIPQLRAAPAKTVGETERPLITLNHPGRAHCKTFTSSDCSWHTPHSAELNSRHFDIIGSTDDDTCTIGHYTMVPLHNSEHNRLPRWLPLLLESTHLPEMNWLSSTSYSSAWTAPDELLMFWEQDDMLMAGVLMMPPQSNIQIEPVVGSIWPFRAESSQFGYEICPFAGRIVIYSEAESEIRVMDYLV